MAKQKEDGKTARKEIRWPPRDLEETEAKASAANTSFSEYVRAATLNKKPKTLTTATGDRRTVLEILADLGRMRSNVKQVGDHWNQLARTGNMRKRFLVEEAILRGVKEIESLGDMAREILNRDRL